jgi:hypothetical protein
MESSSNKPEVHE